MSIANEIQRLQSAKADIKSAIEQKGVTVGDGAIDTYAEKISEISGGGSGDYEQGFEDGKNSVVPLERYVNALQITSLNIFGKSEVVLNLDNATSLNALCYVSGRNNPNKNTTVEHLTINCPNQVTTIQQLLYCDNYNIDYTLKKIALNVDTSKSTRNNSAFGNLRALETIDGTPLSFENVGDSSISCFGNCEALIDFRVVASSIKKSFNISGSPLLSTDTTQSIIDGLATVDTAQTLTLHANVKILQSQVDSANSKGWTVAGGTVVSEEEYYG